MDYDKLVELIVQEVYKKIKSDSKTIIDIEKKKNLVLLWEDDIDKLNSLSKEFNVMNYKEDIKDCDALVISNLNLTGLSNLALGTSVSQEESFILKMIMQGKKIFLMKDGIEYRRYKQTAPKVLYNKYINYEEELRTFGVQVIDKICDITLDDEGVYLETEIIEKSIEVEVIDNKTIDLVGKKLISEGDLRKPHINGKTTLLVDNKSIITPLAKDYIRINRLKIKRV
ncbi:TIGR02536 family ethanolamine utilization protein [Clostridium tarantellae]|uniref:Ethanolamine utilization protein n=1 Tax=Clostridium tarantellae TaxID=39493 RepID=A0A6I1MKD5_9CLOT|nr:TIGR02536 family ethanolamine utilization protein [Clostridium tarantellae]MPQ42898.1 ethanolamine utilization protein [Clostridium tarantellae]